MRPLMPAPLCQPGPGLRTAFVIAWWCPSPFPACLQRMDFLNSLPELVHSRPQNPQVAPYRLPGPATIDSPNSLTHCRIPQTCLGVLVHIPTPPNWERHPLLPASSLQAPAPGPLQHASALGTLMASAKSSSCWSTACTGHIYHFLKVYEGSLFFVF